LREHEEKKERSEWEEYDEEELAWHHVFPQDVQEEDGHDEGYFGLSEAECWALDVEDGLNFQPDPVEMWDEE